MLGGCTSQTSLSKDKHVARCRDWSYLMMLLLWTVTLIFWLFAQAQTTARCVSGKWAQRAAWRRWQWVELWRVWHGVPTLLCVWSPSVSKFNSSSCVIQIQSDLVLLFYYVSLLHSEFRTSLDQYGENQFYALRLQRSLIIASCHTSEMTLIRILKISICMM